MIIVRLMGGLGNQLFQYATALRLAKENNALLFMDISSYERDSDRAYSLEPYGVSASFCDRFKTGVFQGRERVRVVKHHFYEGLPLRWRGCQWVKQQSLDIVPGLPQMTGNIYLDGYWQSEAYFRDIGDLVREEFTLRRVAMGRNETLVQEIASNSAAVSLHIRRGDYIPDKGGPSIHNVCSEKYYDRAFQLVRNAVPNPHVYVFSDDPDWAVQNLRLPCPTTVVGHNSQDEAHEDLRLMTKCHYHIIANSSFSWWGAWLCPYTNKTVFAPERWFNGREHNISSFVPSGWNLVEV